MSAEDKGKLVERRKALVKQLDLSRTYQRAHTATGVWRRKDLVESGAVELEPVSKWNVNERSLENLQRRRRGG